MKNRNIGCLSVITCLITALLCGCSPQLTAETNTYETDEAEELSVNVVDTTAPKGTFENFFIATDSSIKLDAFGLKAEDCSEFTVGFRNYELIKTEEELADIFQKAMAESEELQIVEILNIQWDSDKDNWEERNAIADNLMEEITPEKDGLYRLEIAAVDVHGNATVMNGYALVDAIAFATSETEENLPDDLTAQIDKKPIVPDRFNKDMAQEALAIVNQKRVEAGLHELMWDEGLYEFACTRTLEIISKFSHERPDGTWVTDSLHAMGYTAGNGENIARYSKNASIVVEAWMNSPSHKENILRDYFYYGAIGCYSHNGRYYWVNLFRG